MEQRKTSSLLPSNIVIVAYDATRDHNECELQLTVKNIRMRGDILNGGDTLLVLGVLHTVTHPMGYQTKACTDSFTGPSSRALDEEISRQADLYESMLLRSAEQCKAEGVSMIVKITAGTPTKVVILQEIVSSKATWVILDRNLRKDLKFYVKHVPCKVALIQDSLSVEVMKPFFTNSSNKSVSEQKSFYSDCRTVGFKFNMQETEHNEQSVISSSSYYASSSSLDSSDIFKYNMHAASSFKSLDHKNLAYDETESLSKQAGKHSKGDHRNPSGPRALQGQHDTLFQYDSSEKPILCAVCGLRSILYIKESMRFQFSEIQVATSDFSKENFLGEGGFGYVYKGQLKDGQIIAAKTRKEASTQGYSEFFSELGDFGLARWKSNNDSFHTRVLGSSGYIAPEYAEHGIVSVRTDVYAFGVVLFQLISGRRVVDGQNAQRQHLLEWAEPLVERLALHELIDPRIGESYDTYALYYLARAAFLCVRRNPEIRPSMGELSQYSHLYHLRQMPLHILL
ncbi:putative serine/threonine-protein kinase PBL8 [Cocos nucifera]|uniref:Putative serine/threonine-protein kinase PBL8 n=1 Tax=Cocos nucifera TaxID=13894 RepID=A0A8K0MVY1_COCNU|nr:putative serine/threonine-protein kinase PBL8 [Cocos nucifera]